MCQDCCISIVRSTTWSSASRLYLRCDCLRSRRRRRCFLFNVCNTEGNLWIIDTGGLRIARRAVGKTAV